LIAGASTRISAACPAPVRVALAPAEAISAIAPAIAGSSSEEIATTSSM
jgi:hypothetical protein